MSKINQDSFFDNCQKVLTEHWDKIKTHDITQDIEFTICSEVASMIRSKMKSYRYVLPTQLLAKLTDATLNSRSLQKKSMFDARSLCSKVIVPFERLEGSPLGGSSDPYVNNPLRVAEVSAEYRSSQKDKDGWDLLCDILERIEKSEDPHFVEKVFDQVLLEIRRVQQENKISYPVPQRISLEDSIELTKKFFATKSGGGRLQAVCVALCRTLGVVWGIFDEVSSSPVNVSDASNGRPADIDCKKNKITILAVEVKDRILSLELLEDKITSARIAGVTELYFLVRAESLVTDISVYEKARKEYASGLNIYIHSVDSFFETNLALIGEKGRHVFLLEVGKALEELRLDFTDRQEWIRLLAE